MCIRDRLRDEQTAALVARARATYAARAALLADRLAPIAPHPHGSPPLRGAARPHDPRRPGVSIPPDGLNVWVDVPGDAGAVAGRLAERGFQVRPSSAFAVGGAPRDAIRVTTSTLTAEQADAFTAALHSVTK